MITTEYLSVVKVNCCTTTTAYLSVVKDKAEMAEHVSSSGMYLMAEILHAYGSEGLADIMNSLLENGADVNGKDEYNRTPLHYSVENGHKDVVEILLKAGANVNAADNKKTTPLHDAALLGHEEIVETLLKAGGNADAPDYANMTPLHWAASLGRAEIVETLLNAGANANVKCYLGHTPLIYSDRNCHHEVSECLLKFGAKQGVWKRFVGHVSSTLAIKPVSHTQSTKTVHVLRKSTDGVSRHSEASHTSIMTCEPRDGHTGVIPSTAATNDLQQGSSSADCVTLPSSGRTANRCTVIRDDTEATTSVLPLGLSLQECEDFGNRFVDHLAKFPPLQQKSRKGKFCADVTSVLKNGNITINIEVGNIVVQKFVPESLHVGNTELLSVNSRVNVNRIEPADSDENADDSDSSDNVLKDSDEGIYKNSKPKFWRINSHLVIRACAVCIAVAIHFWM